MTPEVRNQLQGRGPEFHVAGGLRSFPFLGRVDVTKL